mmetsp:Transcript_58238/g.109726  ORF Transcript_58238/g.109726 Transcript_58238/m.109726 type:complete len:474 (-) Transcript_58238:255-1676(-)
MHTYSALGDPPPIESGVRLSDDEGSSVEVQVHSTGCWSWCREQSQNIWRTTANTEHLSSEWSRRKLLPYVLPLIAIILLFFDIYRDLSGDGWASRHVMLWLDSGLFLIFLMVWVLPTFSVWMDVVIVASLLAYTLFYRSVVQDDLKFELLWTLLLCQFGVRSGFVFTYGLISSSYLCMLETSRGIFALSYIVVVVSGSFRVDYKMAAISAELQETKGELQETKAELQETKADLQVTRAELQVTKAQLGSTARTRPEGIPAGNQNALFQLSTSTEQASFDVTPELSPFPRLVDFGVQTVYLHPSGVPALPRPTRQSEGASSSSGGIKGRSRQGTKRSSPKLPLGARVEFDNVGEPTPFLQNFAPTPSTTCLQSSRQLFRHWNLPNVRSHCCPWHAYLDLVISLLKSEKKSACELLWSPLTSWQCEVCLAMNKEESSRCGLCNRARPSVSRDELITSAINLLCDADTASSSSSSS